MDERIHGVPNEIPVVAWGRGSSIFSTDIQAGDKLIINGEIKKISLRIWQKDVFLIESKHIFNETTNYGF